MLFVATLTSRVAVAGAKRDLQPLDNRARDLVLHVEDVFELAVVPLGPQLIAVRRVDELRGDAHARARLAHAALEHVPHLQALRDLADLDRLALERERGRARGDVKSFDLGQRVDDLFGEAVAEVLVLGIGAHVRERQDGDGRRFFDGARPTPAAERAECPPSPETAAMALSPGSGGRCPTAARRREGLADRHAGLR